MLLGGFFNGAKALQAQKLIYIKDVIEYIILVGMWFAVTVLTILNLYSCLPNKKKNNTNY